MILLVLALVATHVDRNQVLAGGAFEKFVRFADGICPSRHFRTITPGDLSWEQELFHEQLPVKRRRRLDSSNLEGPRCGNRNGLSCPTVETLAAMARTGILKRFARFACNHQPPGTSR